ncbi:DUF4365 domain-containing protein [Arthrobacter cheniae]|uniref:DUF4365 domain-containing protein n=1 Tax=Arthrobacter cheniae TaxID=1258888 RepID=A0A3A5LZ94_9MICC|nr:DUF4365 domain-containing protein [Arthrobacter cheniae]RJT75643.1 DUF4365 domain-containing protein [Arthrobacter cheniae]
MRTLCAHVGASFTETSIDEDVMAIDGTVDFARMPVRVQIKCTSQFSVAGNRLTLPLELSWVEKWTISDTPVIVVVVKVPSDIPGWLDYDVAFTRPNTVAFGRRFDAATDVTSMVFTSSDRLTGESIHDWRDLAYDIADGVVT